MILDFCAAKKGMKFLVNAAQYRRKILGDLIFSRIFKKRKRVRKKRK